MSRYRSFATVSLNDPLTDTRARPHPIDELPGSAVRSNSPVSGTNTSQRVFCPVMSAVKYIAVRSDGSLVRYGDQIGYTTYPGHTVPTPGHTVPTWFEFAAGLQNHDRFGDAGGSGGQV